MSLDVSLWVKGKEVYSANITHNLTQMAQACGVYVVCWRPEERYCELAEHILPTLMSGIELLKSWPEVYRKLDAPNGWGTYDHFVPWLEDYAEACRTWPDAKIQVDR